MIRNATAATVLAVAALISLAPSTASAGTTGTIVGTVVDATTGTPIAGAKVSAISPAEVETTTSDARGRFVFVSLAPGDYTVVAEHARWTEDAVHDVTVLADRTTTVDPRLRLVPTAVVTVDGPFTFYGHGMGIRRIPDLYTYSVAWNSDAARPDANIQDIRFTPGIVTARGAAAMR